MFKSNYAIEYREKVDGNKNTGQQALKRMSRVGVHNQGKISNYYKNLLFNDDKVNGDNEFYDSIGIDSGFKDFTINKDLNEYIITLLGYTNVRGDGSRHTNWFPWNRFKDVYETIGYRCEWVELEKLERKGEKRLFITWNEPTSLELYQSGKVNKNDIIFQKLTSLGKGMNNVNWTSNPKKWCEKWNWPIYKTVENLYDKANWIKKVKNKG